MSKKWVAFLLVACIGLAGAVVYMRMNTDTQGPEITFTDQAPTLYHSDMNNNELLAGVTATDNKDGDVSSSLTVESVYEMDASHVVVTYTAKDKSNNITKQKLELEMDSASIKEASKDTSGFGEQTDAADAEATTGADTKNTEKADAKAADTSDSQTSEQDSEDTSSVEETKETPTPTPEVDEAQAEKEKQEAEANAMPSQNPKIYLTDYLIKVPVGTSVDLLSYVSEIKDDSDDVYALWRKVQITGEVNSAVPGTYKCTYYVIDSQNNISNNAVLTVIVE